MDGKALVTGAAHRLGRAMALALADAGLDVAVHFASSDEAAQSLVEEIRARGRRAAALQTDLLDESQTASLVGRASDALGGPLTVLVNNASIFERDTIKTGTRDSWDRHIESNLRAPVVLTQSFAAQVPPARIDAAGEPKASGLVVNMLDQRIHKLTPDFMSYTIAKMGLWAFTRTAAQALAPAIRVNAIGPGPTLQGANQSADQFGEQRRATVLERGANTDDITAALLYFVNAPAVTGQILAIDGGQHLAWKTPDVQDVE